MIEKKVINLNDLDSSQMAGLAAILLGRIDYKDIRQAQAEYVKDTSQPRLTPDGEKSQAALLLVCDFAEQFQKTGHKPIPLEKPLWEGHDGRR